MIISCVGLCLVACVLIGCRSEAGPGSAVPITIEGRQFKLEPAIRPSQWREGLSDRPSIAEDGGMLFVFNQARRRQFVMRKCLVPIDLIFLNPNGRIVAMHQMRVEPYDRPDAELRHYSSRYPARFAIELQGGTLDELSLKRGQKLALPLDRLKRLVD